MGFCKKRWVFRKKTLKISKNADGSKFDVECHRNSKFFKTLKHWAVQNNRRFFSEKNLNFLKTVEVSQLDVECERNSKISQNFQKLGFFAKEDAFSEEKPWSFQKLLMLAGLLQNATRFVRFLKKFKKFELFWKKRWVFQKKLIFRKWLEVAILLYNATETVKFLKTFKFLAVIKKI